MPASADSLRTLWLNAFGAINLAALPALRVVQQTEYEPDKITYRFVGSGSPEEPDIELILLPRVQFTYQNGFPTETGEIGRLVFQRRGELQALAEAEIAPQLKISPVDIETLLIFSTEQGFEELTDFIVNRTIPAIRISFNNLTTREDSGQISITIEREGYPAPVRVYYDLTGFTSRTSATPGLDFSIQNELIDDQGRRYVDFEPGQTNANVILNLIDDNAFEQEETFVFELDSGDPANSYSLTNRTSRITIQDDEVESIQKTYVDDLRARLKEFFNAIRWEAFDWQVPGGEELTEEILYTGHRLLSEFDRYLSNGGFRLPASDPLLGISELPNFELFVLSSAPSNPISGLVDGVFDTLRIFLTSVDPLSNYIYLSEPISTDVFFSNFLLLSSVKALPFIFKDANYNRDNHIDFLTNFFISYARGPIQLAPVKSVTADNKIDVRVLSSNVIDLDADNRISGSELLLALAGLTWGTPIPESISPRSNVLQINLSEIQSSDPVTVSLVFEAPVFAKEPLGNEPSWRAPGTDFCLLNILNADRA